jgi:hypothetical protein
MAERAEQAEQAAYYPGIKVVIYPYDAGCQVTPGHALVSPGTEVAFRNLTAGLVTLMFPDEGLFGEQIVRIEARGTEYRTVGGVEPGFYPYQAHCDNEATFALGGSGPGMIVD